MEPRQAKSAKTSMNLLSYGALPVLTVLAAQFPTIGSFLFSWVQPLLQALRG
jgi:hypothetical protein